MGIKLVKLVGVLNSLIYKSELDTEKAEIKYLEWKSLMLQRAFNVDSPNRC